MAPVARVARVVRRVPARVKAVPRAAVRRARVAHRVRAAQVDPGAILAPTVVSSAPIGRATTEATVPTVGPVLIAATVPIGRATTAATGPTGEVVPTAVASVCRRVASPSR